MSGIRDRCDVLVAGGGPGGMMAGIAAARAGAHTLIVERTNCFGGMATSGALGLFGPFDDGERRIIGGLPAELLDRLVDLGGAEAVTTGFVPFNHEILKRVADEMVLESGADFLFHALVVDVKRREDGIESATVATKEGVRHIRASVFVDGTGDGDLLALGGVPFEMGRSEDGLVQPMTLTLRIGGVTPEYRWEGNYKYATLIKELQDRGEFSVPTEMIGAACRVPGAPGVLSINMSRLIKLDPCRSQDVTRATIEGRRQAEQIVRFFVEHVPGCSRAFLLETASAVGVRESRRLVGAYQLTREDVLEGRRFADTICMNRFVLDIHCPAGRGDPDKDWTSAMPQRAYGVPYRCLYSPEVRNLLVAGRPISATHEAHSSTRIMPCCMAVGQAAGRAAAVASQTQTPVDKIDVSVLQGELRRQGAMICVSA